MKNKNTFHPVLAFAVALILLVNTSQASAGMNPAPKTQTPTPTIAISTPPGPTSTPGPTQTPGPAPSVGSTELTGGWALVSANNVGHGGGTISQTGYNVSGWYPISVPSTVLAGLVANDVYQNIYFGENLKSVPDLTTQNWWYRGEFTAPAGVAGQQYWLRFKGIAYRAEIWLNGTLLDANAVGTMVHHEYNVTSLINSGAANAVAVKVTPPAKGGNELSFWYVDWNPAPPDMNAGIWNKVFLDTSGPVALRDPYVKTVLPLPATSSAALTVYVDAINGTNTPISGTVSGTITKAGYPSITFSQSVTLAPNERREITFDPATFPQLNVMDPALWWPFRYGNAELYQLSVSFTAGGQTWDSQAINFGVRQITDARTTVNGTSYVRYKVNGQDILIRGADWVWDMLARWDTKTNEAHFRYVKDMGLNTVRFEGILGDEELYDIADREGILLMPGFVCCSKWEAANTWNAEDHIVAYGSFESQMRALRHHAGSLVWAIGSDERPPAAELAAYKNIVTALHWQNPTLDNVATWSNPDAGVDMDGPYMWEPPVYWYLDSSPGAAVGFTAEAGGESPPPEESLRKFIGEADLWPISPVWGYHAGSPRSVFDNIDVYTDGVNKRYGATTNITEYSSRSELLNYESERAEFEAWGANAYTKSFGVIYWMLNNAWPSVHWNLYDYYMKPGGGYFGTKKALEPVHVIYDYATSDVKVFNSTLASYTDMTVSATVYNIPDLAQQYGNQVTLNIPANASTQALTIPPLTGLSTTYFIRLQLRNSSNQLVSDNTYWYSTTKDALVRHSTWYKTGVKTYANLTGLNSLPANNSVTASASRTIADGEETVNLTLINTSTTNIAFFARAEVTQGNGGEEVLPVTYTDNYVTIWPGESITITARYATADLAGQLPYLRLRGYNIPTFNIAVP